MNKELLSADLDSIPQKITRALEDGPDYRPEWRHLQVQKYLKYLNSGDQPDAEALARLDEILPEESDQFVRDLLLFHCDRPCSNKEGIAYAVKCQRDSKTRSASAIKALVIANGSPERIAHEFGTTKDFASCGTVENLHRQHEREMTVLKSAGHSLYYLNERNRQPTHK